MIKLSLSKGEFRMASDHNFEELEAPAKTAEELHISVATLRKYSKLLNYWKKTTMRTKQKSRYIQLRY